MERKKVSERGELRRRVRAQIASGVMARLGSEARLVAMYVFMFADFKDCRVRLSARGAAKTLCVRHYAIQRGVAQLVEVGFLVPVDGTKGGRRVYEVPNPIDPGPAREPAPEPARGRRMSLMEKAKAKAEAKSGTPQETGHATWPEVATTRGRVATTGGQSGHVAWPEWPRSVARVATTRGPIQLFPIDLQDKSMGGIIIPPSPPGPGSDRPGGELQQSHERTDRPDDLLEEIA